MIFRNVAIIGGGMWGSALAICFAKTLDVTLVVRSPDEAREMAASRTNPRYLPDRTFPDNVRIGADIAGAVAAADLVFIAAPVSAFEAVLETVAATRTDIPVIWGCKGFCPVSGDPLSYIAEKILGPDACYGVFSGPSFAEGIAQNDPTAVVVATNRGQHETLEIARILSNSTLRIYANNDLVGVQICGAIKNVYAIAAGIIDGCGWGDNTRAAMMTRAVAEARHYLKKHKSKRSTLMGLAGFGDIYLTCGSRHSRNYQVGMSLAAGQPIGEILANLGHVAEGVPVTRLICQRAALLGLEMPIVTAVSQVIDGLQSPRDCAGALMARDIRHEKRKVSAAATHLAR